MKVKIYTAAVGNTDSPQAAGWAFTVVRDVALTGDITMQYSGCTGATLITAQAMVVLQALYWLREHRKTIKEYVIYCDNPECVNDTVLKDRIADLRPASGSIIKLDREDDYSEMNETMATKAWFKIVHQHPATFDSVEVGDVLCQKQKLFSETHVVMAKFLGSNMLSLKNMSTISKQVVPYSRIHFDLIGFIKMS